MWCLPIVKFPKLLNAFILLFCNTVFKNCPWLALLTPLSFKSELLDNGCLCFLPLKDRAGIHLLVGSSSYFGLRQETGKGKRKILVCMCARTFNHFPSSPGMYPAIFHPSWRSCHGFACSHLAKIRHFLFKRKQDWAWCPRSQIWTGPFCWNKDSSGTAPIFSASPDLHYIQDQK